MFRLSQFLVVFSLVVATACTQGGLPTSPSDPSPDPPPPSDSPKALTVVVTPQAGSVRPECLENYPGPQGMFNPDCPFVTVTFDSKPPVATYTFVVCFSEISTDELDTCVGRSTSSMSLQFQPRVPDEGAKYAVFFTIPGVKGNELIRYRKSNGKFVIPPPGDTIGPPVIVPCELYPL